MRRHPLMVLAVVLASLLCATSTRAQTQPPVANYAAGWNMVGGPAGTSFSGASYLYTYTSSGYAAPGSNVATACQGYWAYFTMPTSLSLPAAATGPAACSLAPGWNLVGNPFSGLALLPSGMSAYWWNPDANKYQLVQSLPVGGAAWIFTTAAISVTLQYQAVATAPAANLVISDLTTAGPYRMHVGDTVELLLPSVVGYTATTSSTVLSLESAGVTGPLSCTGDPSCALSLVNQFWIWRAVQAGTTFIIVTPRCPATSPHCASSQRIEIDILP